MIIKHWQGYGCVSAKQLSSKDVCGKCFKEIEVSGEHEWGLVRDDAYDLNRWLLSKFEKRFKVDDRNLEYDYYPVPGRKEETVLYTFVYDLKEGA